MEDPKKLLQEANGFLRTAERSMFSGKNEEAVELLNKADDIVSSAKQQIPDDFQVKSLSQKIEKMRKDLERKGVSTRPGGNNEVPFEVQAQLNRIRDHIVKKELEWAKKEIDNYYSRFAGPFTELAEIAEFKQHIQNLEIEAKAAEEQKNKEKEANEEIEQKTQELCREWEGKFRSIPYFEGTAHNAQTLLQEKEHFQKAKLVVDEYEKVVFEAQISITLESLCRDVKVRINEFQSKLSQTLSMLLQEVVQSIEERLEFLNRDTAWMQDSNQKPHIIGQNEIDTFLRRIDELRPLFSENPSEMESALNAISKLEEMNYQRKIERSKLITIRPEAISGPEAEEPTSAAINALKKTHPTANVLKTSVVKMWETKRVEEWADSTKTQWIVKNFKETIVEIAAELSDGSCKLFTLHVEKDINPDGTFGNPRSHIMFEDLMAKESIA